MSAEKCKLCGHERGEGIICAVRECRCFCEFPPGTTELPELPPLPQHWEEEVIMQAFDAVMCEREADIKVKTPSGFDCVVKVRFVPSVGLHVVAGGKA
jgi:hypothetical protein